MLNPPVVAGVSEAVPGVSADFPSGGGRIVGLDVARGLAVLGMFGAHLLVIPGDLDWGATDTWPAIVNGRSSILFAVLAGVSIAIISGRTRPVEGVPLLQARVRILTRAALIVLIGGLLEALFTPVAIILGAYGLLFVAAVPFLRWSAPNLFVAAAVSALLMPILNSFAIIGMREAELGDSAVTTVLFSGSYPATIWITFMLLGLGVGRLTLESPTVQLRLGLVGVGLAALGYGVGSFVWAAVSASGTFFGKPLDLDSSAMTGSASGASLEPANYFSALPHTGSTFEVVGSSGFALAVIALCLWAGPRLRVALFPLAATGAMALTAYSAHVFVVMWAERNDLLWLDNALFFWLAGGTLVFCTGWTLTLGRGPLERLLTMVSRRAASVGGSSPNDH
ncbi:heparan-alpha-glucosaminide N-acetyltransferase domain-containing protein [Klugiella xanthotipulae]|uniref:Putative membrane protein YeiB n=1 Tax=Klugiella xanthotipulae TaxID=244735 RepID=A0A543I3X0_9MICO|nr:heparan-alpha-glucosaminide N-acetyltransferase domain-containing protein [Klugiella xanthotipulae]TQM65296.1 putative membrane protein YeiB [Klugiella xanthotipulae]